MEKLILEDLFKVLLGIIDSYNSKILQNINEKYTVIDKSMLSAYLYIKILENRNERNDLSVEVLRNYLLKQSIYGETGNLALEFTDKSKMDLYNKVINELIVEKFEYKNRVMKRLKYDYKILDNNEFTNLLKFCESIAEISILNKLARRGNKEAEEYLKIRKNKLVSIYTNNALNGDKFKDEKINIIYHIKEEKFEETDYFKLLEVALKLRDVYRYSTLTTVLPENVLFHQYIISVTCILFADYLKRELNENINIYTLLLKALFHDFGEYNGNEIVTQVKNYNEDTIAMFGQMQRTDEEQLRGRIGDNLYNIISDSTDGAEGYILEILDKVTAIMKLWIEVKYMGNNTYIKATCSVFQSRFKRFEKIKKIDELKKKDFYLDFVREAYIYVKENLIEYNPEITLEYFTKDEIEVMRNEINEIKKDKNIFLKPCN